MADFCITHIKVVLCDFLTRDGLHDNYVLNRKAIPRAFFVYILLGGGG